MTKQLKYRQDRSYNSNHLWVKETESGELIVGMDELGLDSMGELAYLTLPQLGSELQKATAMGSIEAAKMTGELIAPASGVVSEINTEILKNPLMVNEDPYVKGWLLKIQPTNWNSESKSLFSGDNLQAWWEAETIRFETQGSLD